MADFKIKISTPADTSGAKTTSQDLGKLKQSTDQATAGFDKYEKQLERVTHSKRGFRTALHQVTQELPIFGAALQAIGNPLTAVILGLGYAVKKFNDFREEVDAAAKKMEMFASSAITVRDFSRMIAETKNERRAFAQELASIAAQAGNATDQMTRLQTASAFRAQLRGKLETAQAEAEKRKIDLAADQGLITPEQAAVRKHRIDVGRAAAGREDELGGVRAEIDAAAQAAMTERQRLREARGAFPGAEKEEQAAKARLQSATALHAAHVANAPTVDVDALLARREALGRQLALPFGVRALDLTPEKIRQQMNAIDLEIASVGISKQGISQAAALMTLATGDVSRAGARRTGLESAISGGETRLAGFESRVAAGKGRLAEMMPIFGQISQLEGGPMPSAGGPLIATPRENIMANAAISMRGGTRAAGARLFESEKNEIVAALREVLREMAGEIRQSKSREARDLPFTWR